MLNYLVLLLFACSARVLPAQQFSTVEFGHIFDRPSGSIRPIVGFPGSAWLGTASCTGLAWASVAPDGEQALAVREGQLQGILLGSAIRNEVGLLEPVSQDEYASVWANDSQAAVSWTQVAGSTITFQLWGTSPRGPVRLTDVPSDFMPDQLRSVVVRSRPDLTILTAMDRDGAEGIYRFDLATKQWAQVLTGSFGALALDATQQVIWALDNNSSQLQRFAADNGAQTGVPISVNNTSCPCFLAVAPGDQRVALAETSSRQVQVADVMAGRVTAILDVEGPIDGLSLLNPKGIWVVHLRTRPDDTNTVFDLARIALTFVPAGSNP